MKYLVIFALLFILITSVTSAQDGITVTIPDIPGDGTGGNDDFPVDTIWDLIGLIVAVGSTITFTVVGITYGLSLMRQNVGQMTILEKVADLVPKDVVDTIHDMSKTIVKLANLAEEAALTAEEATDGIPVATKVTQPALTIETIDHLIYSNHPADPPVEPKG